MRSVRRALWIAATARVMVAPLALASFGAGCDPPRQAAPAPREEEAPRLVGISPDKFRCDSLATIEQMSELLGAPARFVETSMSSQDGTAAPCNYLVRAGEQEAWTFDIDCRDGMKKRADALFEQYERTSAEMVALAAVAPPPTGTSADALKSATKGDGAAKPARKPELAREVVVGSRGLDHHGSGLLFIDDDAPCYVRIVGRDADRRLALAKHLAAALTPSTAPMSPRPVHR